MKYICLTCGAVYYESPTANDATNVQYLRRCEACKANGY
ncbi:hypothetical protein LCGC14_1454880 [marine sediment metagenome]|uniref:Rubredoxin-like domain-containing protein n=1 Tax=marine sediment metagenome TaxID=412755 RepID=A0A0F9JGQ2_9ZZZZ